jgi:HEAT repeat protein
VNPRPRRGWAVTLAAVGLSVALLGASAFTFGGRIREEWLLYRLRSGDLTSRYRAAEELADLQSARALPGLIQLLRDSEVEVQRTRGEVGHSLEVDLATICRRFGPSAVPPLLQELKHSNAYRREAAAICLSFLKAQAEPLVMPALVSLLEDNERSVRFRAVVCLDLFVVQSVDAQKALTRAVSDSDKAVSAYARRSLEKLGTSPSTSATNP